MDRGRDGFGKNYTSTDLDTQYCNSVFSIALYILLTQCVSSYRVSCLSQQGSEIQRSPEPHTNRHWERWKVEERKGDMSRKRN